MSKEDKLIGLLYKQGEINKEIRHLLSSSNTPKPLLEKLNELLIEF